MTGMDDLDDFFSAARSAGPVPSGALEARVLADADAALPRPVAGKARPLGLWQRLAAGWSARLGSGGVMATGLASAVVAGVFIGYAGPVTSDWLGAALSGDEEVQMTAASDLFLGEG